MSRIGNSEIIIPEGVTVTNEKNIITVKGPLGELLQEIDTMINFKIIDNSIMFSRNEEDNDSRSKHGLYRSLIANMIEGVTKGHTKKLELRGVGYRATTQGNVLDISAGYSHNIVLDIPVEVKVNTLSEKGQSPIVILNSIDKQLLGLVASKIRSFRKPEPYKGKGIRYIGEYVRRKAGKTAAAA